MLPVFALAKRNPKTSREKKKNNHPVRFELDSSLLSTYHNFRQPNLRRIFTMCWRVSTACRKCHLYFEGTVKCSKPPAPGVKCRTDEFPPINKSPPCPACTAAAPAPNPKPTPGPKPAPGPPKPAPGSGPNPGQRR